MRLATTNGYRSLKWLFGLVGQRRVPKDLRLINFAKLSELTTHPESVLRDLAYVQSGRGLRRFLGQELPSFLVEQNRPKICVECLKGEFKIPALWDLSLMVCCPKHGGYLLGECPGCHSMLRWDRPAWDRCRCGYDFADFQPERAPATIQSYAMCLCSTFDQSEKKNAPDDFPSVARNLSVSSLMTLTTIVGQWSIYECNASLDRVFAKKTIAERSGFVGTTMAILQDWPNEFNSFLDRVKGKDPCPNASISMHRDFGRLHYNLMYALKAVDLDFVREALKRYDESRRIPIDLPPSDNDTDIERRLDWTARRVGVGLGSLKKMVQAGGMSLVLAQPVGKHKRVEVDQGGLAQYEERKASRMTYSEVVRALGTNPKATRDLIDSGLFNKDRTTVLDGRGNESYLKSEVDAFLKRLKGLSRPIADAGGKKLASTGKAFQGYASKSFTRYDIVTAILDKQLNIYSDQPIVNLSTVHVHLDELADLVAGKVIGGDSHLIAIKTAMTRYGLSKDELWALIRNNSISFVYRKFGGRRFCLVDEKNLKALRCSSEL